MLLIYMHSRNTNSENKSKFVLTNSKRFVIISNRTRRLLDNTNSENKSKFVLTNSKRFVIIIAQVKTKATS